eukprot:4508612-Lingulodinium_polyedra.AAC.1
MARCWPSPQTGGAGPRSGLSPWAMPSAPRNSSVCSMPPFTVGDGGRCASSRFTAGRRAPRRQPTTRGSS